jgi:hypothetical protein
MIAVVASAMPEKDAQDQGVVADARLVVGASVDLALFPGTKVNPDKFWLEQDVSEQIAASIPEEQILEKMMAAVDRCSFPPD